MHEHAGVDVFGNGVGLEPTDLHERAASEESRTPGKEGAIVAVTAGLKGPKKQDLLVFQFCFETEIFLKNVRIVKVMGSLDDRDSLVLEEPDRLAQEGRRWYMIGIEDRNQFSRSLLESMVQIPGLGVIAALPCDIRTAH